MSLLAPLYIAGALAIALPILFHLIRRTPQGRQEFSSLMFLSPSPPRITKRSRIQNWLLLLLRATALAILALAFARPFLRQAADASVTEARGRRVAILIDSSASMARADLADQARRQGEAALNELRPADEVALYRFDRGVTPVFSFEQWNGLPQERRVAALRSYLASITPAHDTTRIGDALATVADVLAAGQEGDAGGIERRIILISDMQRGGQVETLQRFEWPTNVTLEVRPVTPQQTTNASLQLVREAEPDAPADAERSAAGPRLRVGVSNEPGGTREQFSLAWANEKSVIAAAEVKTYVPPGRSHVVRMALPDPAEQADRIVLAGDDFDFDNTLFVVPPRTENVRVVYIGEDDEADVKGLQYYVRNAYGDTSRRKVDFVARRPADGLSDADVVDARLIIVAATVADDRLPALRRYLEAGGDVLWVLRDAPGAQPLARLLRVDAPEVEESPNSDFALIARVEFDHPLFAPFADARFADFSKIHFWKHRRVTVDEGSDARVLARFDRGDPFLVEQSVGDGRVFVMTSGWHPADSQLALSTKFVPLMEGFLTRRDAVSVDAQYAVHQPIALPKAAGDSERVMVGPDGRRVMLRAGAATFAETDRPGVYRLAGDGAETSLAVNLSAEESRTAALAAEELEQFGVQMGGARASAELTERRRQLERTELENRQKLWRWLIVGVIGLLAAETFLAGRLARRERIAGSQSVEPQETT